MAASSDDQSASWDGAGEAPGCADTMPLQTLKTLDDVDRPPTPRRAYDQRLRELNAIGLALSSERDIQKLLDLILSKARELTNADAGSLYLVEKDLHSGESALLFHTAQNDSIRLDTMNRRVAVGPSSLAGYVALTGEALCFDDVYELPSEAPYKFNPTLDKETGYRTKSVLVLPLSNHAHEIVGVLQLINRKQQRDVPLHDRAAFEREVIPFDGELVDLARSLASQAAVALDNSRLLAEVQDLLDEISDLFDSFVMASADAIESRDPSTSGHSKRVTAMTVGLAVAANEAEDGPFRDLRYTPQEIREIRYAALLHDFGKIGVREHVLLKSHKIEASQFNLVLSRIELLRRARAIEAARAQTRWWRDVLDGRLTREDVERRVENSEAELACSNRELDAACQLLRDANEPYEVMPNEKEHERRMSALNRIAEWRYPDEEGVERPLITTEELHALGIKRGNLTPDEYAQVQRHAGASYTFLKQIPWTEDLQNVPDFAHAHHEKLNGSGYPRKLRGDQIPLPARMMAVADIYDALTSSERPYKRALNRREALRILELEADSGAIDRQVLDLFIARKIYKLTEGWSSSALS